MQHKPGEGNIQGEFVLANNLLTVVAQAFDKSGRLIASPTVALIFFTNSIPKIENY